LNTLEHPWTPSTSAPSAHSMPYSVNWLKSVTSAWGSWIPRRSGWAVCFPIQRWVGGKSSVITL